MKTIEFFNNSIYINGEQLVSFREHSDGYEIWKWVFKKKKFTRDEMREFCYENDIKENLFDIYISFVNKKAQKKIGEKIVLSNKSKINKMYWINQNLTGEILVVLKLPKEVWAKYEKQLKSSQINKGDDNDF
jgi:tyrosyl-tRNA synthetase